MTIVPGFGNSPGFLDQDEQDALQDFLTNNPGQQVPKAIGYWEAGKLYQPGDLVQSNNYGDVAQTTVTNPGFELGDQDWVKGSLMTIGAGTAFAGSNRARYAGQDAATLHFPAASVANDIAGNIYTDLATDGQSGSLNFSVELVLAANDTRVIAVGQSETEGWYSTDGGVNFTPSTTPPGGTRDNVFWLPTASLFVAFSTGTAYSTSPDGDVWTDRTFAASVGSRPHIITNAGADYLLAGTSVYSTTNGTAWTLRTAAAGLNFNTNVVSIGTEFVAVSNVTSSSQRIYRSSDLVTWTFDAAGTTSLEAAWINASGDRSIAANGTTLVGVYHNNTVGTNTGETVRSIDGGVTWAAVASAPNGNEVYYSPGFSKFLTYVGAGGSDNNVYSSTAGLTWATYNLSVQPRAGGRFSEQAPTIVRNTLVSEDRASVFAGQIVSAAAKARTSANVTAFIGIRFFDSGGTALKTFYGTGRGGASANWREIEVSARAPLDSATCAVVLAGEGTAEVLYDDVSWDHFTQEEKSPVIFEATQADAGYSGSSEPVWPTVVGNTVVDNEVTWTARAANCVVWEAKPILFSGASEPTWPEEEGATVVDGSILWTADSGRVKDRNCPNTKEVAIAAGKVFAGDDDIVAFCATVNPLDWSSRNDAGFIPFGLNTYGGEPVSALGIYRSNLVVWNSKAFQMWQVDADPQNFAILDAIPVGNRFYRSASPVSNDLVWLTDEGVRSMGIAGASSNLAAGYFGKQIDPVVLEALDALADEDDVLSLFYPGQGQYWIILGATAFVLTMNGSKSDMSWSRYTFPDVIDDYTIKNSKLYLLSGDKVWLFDEDAVQDDVNGTPVNYEGRVWWHYLDFGSLGVDKEMQAFDVVASGTFNMAVGYNQNNTAVATDDYELTGDTLPNDVIPLSVTAPSLQFRLTWAGGEEWEWQASAIYLQNNRTMS